MPFGTQWCGHPCKLISTHTRLYLFQFLRSHWWDVRPLVKAKSPTCWLPLSAPHFFQARPSSSLCPWHPEAQQVILCGSSAWSPTVFLPHVFGGFRTFYTLRHFIRVWPTWNVFHGCVVWYIRTQGTDSDSMPSTEAPVTPNFQVAVLTPGIHTRIWLEQRHPFLFPACYLCTGRLPGRLGTSWEWRPGFICVPVPEQPEKCLKQWG